jgi:hypothetical protein
MALHKGKADEGACDTTIYQSMIGSLMCIMAATSANMAYFIGVLSWYTHHPIN